MAQMQREGQRAKQRTSIPLYPHWQLVFEKYDRDSDGRISLAELKHLLKSESYQNDIPKHAVQQILKKADENESGYLEFHEFLKMTEHEEVRGVMHNALNRYIRATVVQRRRFTADVLDGAGDYEREYSCYPPAVLMVIISLVEVIIFLNDVIDTGESSIKAPAATLFIYNPFKRYEVWRFFTYMFVHVGVFHLVVNLLVQIMLGIPLEMVHGWWRVLLVYIAGVVAGSLGTSISDPGVYLAGASGGVYAIIAAHLATICMNWAEMQFALLQLLVFLSLTVVDIGTAVYTRYIKGEPNQLGADEMIPGITMGLLSAANSSAPLHLQLKHITVFPLHATTKSRIISSALNNMKNFIHQIVVTFPIGYAAHLAGALAGLLVGINVLRNLEVKSWERKLWWASITVYTVLMLAAIIWNAAFPDYFPPSH